MNKELCEGLIDILNSCKGSVVDAYNYWVCEEKDKCIITLDSLNETIKSMYVVSKNNFSDIPEIKLSDACKCILVSIAGINSLIAKESQEVTWKIKNELLPITETTYLQFLYWSFVHDNEELLETFYEEVSNANMFNYLDDNIDLSIIITGYNHLDVTVGAVESVLRELPDDINVEVVLNNHGSSDETLAYFNSIKCDNIHIFNVAINGAVPAAFVGTMSGRVRMHVSNDVVIGVDALKNMYKAIVEDESIGWLVPATPNVSNLQPIDLSYNNNKQFLERTKENNKYDINRHEQRVRLCNPIDALPANVMLRFYKEMYVEFVCSNNFQSFPDDKLAVWMRRNGYKMILQKDAFCHHVGSVTLKDEIAPVENAFYNDGRKLFLERFGIDPWGKGMCYDRFFYNTSLPEYDGEDNLFILGVNCGLGSDSLKVREILKENGAKSLKLVNITDEDKFLLDLQGVSDEAYLSASITEYVNQHSVEKIDYLVVDEYEEGLYAFLDEVEKLNIPVKMVYYKSGAGKWTVRCLDNIISSNNKRIVLLNGGLGNQLYQYTFGRMIEVATGEQVIYDDTYFYQRYDHNGYELEKVFGAKLELLSSHFDEAEWKLMMEKYEKGVSIPQQLNDKGWNLMVMAECDLGGSYEGNIINMPPKSASAEVRYIYESVKGNTYYNGYWRCENKLANLMSDIIISELHFPDLFSNPEIPSINREYMKQIQNTDSVGVHVRRGDFVDCGRSVELEKFDAAIKKVLEQNATASFYIFSDDILWCKEHSLELGFDNVKNLTYITGNVANGYNYIDMQLMSECKMLIITNSSFGTWAKNFNKTVNLYVDYIG